MRTAASQAVDTARPLPSSRTASARAAFRHAARSGSYSGLLSAWVHAAGNGPARGKGGAAIGRGYQLAQLAARGPSRPEPGTQPARVQPATPQISALLVPMVAAALLMPPTAHAGGLQDSLTGAVEAAGAAGPAVFVLLYVLLTVLLFPASVLTVAAGALYGGARSCTPTRTRPARPAALGLQGYCQGGSTPLPICCRAGLSVHPYPAAHTARAHTQLTQPAMGKLKLTELSRGKRLNKLALKKLCVICRNEPRDGTNPNPTNPTPHVSYGSSLAARTLRAAAGPLWGTALVSLASTSGATAAFLLARILASRSTWLESKLAGAHPRQPS
jgi:hypothetical protein